MHGRQSISQSTLEFLMSRVCMLALLLVLPLASLSSAQGTAPSEDCATCADVNRVLSVMQDVIIDPHRERTAAMKRRVIERLAAVCSDASEKEETVCDIPATEPGKRLTLAMSLNDERRMSERAHFLWVTMHYQTQRPERMRELGRTLGSDWRKGQSDACTNEIWRSGPATHTFTRMKIRGRWQDGSVCEDHVDAVELLITDGDFPLPRLY